MNLAVAAGQRFEFAANSVFSEYYPQNIMYDKRVHRGNTFAAMVIPAGTNHDTMIMEKKQTQKRTFRSSIHSKVGLRHFLTAVAENFEGSAHLPEP